MTDRPLIAARSLRVRLAGQLVLDDVSVALPAGQLCALVGPNGAGKSTLLRTLCGLVSTESGDVVLAGSPSSPLASLADRARQVAYVPQDRIVHWDLAVAPIVALGRLPHGRYGNGQSPADAQAIAAAMARMDVAHLAHRPIRQLSGGEQARVLIARALAQATPVLLADEPVAGLDIAHQLSLFEHLRALAREGRAVLVALHDLSLALRFADQVVLLDRGRVVAQGTPSDVLSRQALSAVFGIDARLGRVDGVPVLVPFPATPRDPGDRS